MTNFNLKNSLKLFITASCFLFANLSTAQTFRILVTNDDGIESPLLISLAQALNELSNIEVVVSAPSENQSGSSHSSIGGPLTVRPVSYTHLTLPTKRIV